MLSTLIWLPLVGAIVVAVAPKSLSSQRPASGVWVKNRSSVACQTVSKPSTLVRTRTSATSASGAASSSTSKSPDATTPMCVRWRTVRSAGNRYVSVCMSVSHLPPA